MGEVLDKTEVRSDPRSTPCEYACVSHLSPARTSLSRDFWSVLGRIAWVEEFLRGPRNGLSVPLKSNRLYVVDALQLQSLPACRCPFTAQTPVQTRPGKEVQSITCVHLNKALLLWLGRFILPGYWKQNNFFGLPGISFIPVITSCASTPLEGDGRVSLAVHELGFPVLSHCETIRYCRHQRALICLDPAR